MPVDKFGIPFFYPTAEHAGVSGEGNGFSWFQNNDIMHDAEGTGFIRLGKEFDDVQVIDEDTGEWEFPYLAEGDGLSMSGPTGHHTGGETHGCQGFTYMVDGNFDVNPPSFRFRKETYHVEYDDHPDGTFTSPFATQVTSSAWKGMAWVRYNKKDGISAGKDSVICEVWWNDNPTADITNWKMLKRVEDKGAGITNWGVASATCDGVPYQVGTWSNIQFRFKSAASDFSLHPLIPEGEDDPVVHSIGGENMSFADSENRGYGKRADMPRDIEMKCLFKWDAGGAGKCHFKNLSLREIDPTKSFDDTPENPDEPSGNLTTIQGLFVLKQDINHSRVSACAGTGGGGGAGGLTTFYTITANSDTELSNTTLFQNRTRGGEQCLSSLAPIHNKLLAQLDVPLKKVGTPGATPVINAKIWSSGGAVIYTSPTTIAPNALTTSYTTQSFNFSTNTHRIATGDVVGVEYITTSDTNYVVFGYDDNTIANAQYVNREAGAWEPKPTTRDFACTMWE